MTEKYGIYFPTDKETVYYAGLDDEDLEFVEYIATNACNG